ncbi:MAG TPA: tyrosine-type recombinase/integrase [Syntrophomonadaceae bacterium]|nr:tyrosine-type recombinase/integrase [Syntrophomonadaceae bacterium]
MIQDGMYDGDTFFRDAKLHYSPETYSAYTTAIKQFKAFSQKEISQVDRNDVDKWIESLLENNNSPRTVHAKLSALRTYFNYEKGKREVNYNPTYGIELPDIDDGDPRPLVAQEKFFLREAAKDHLRDRAMIETFLTSGVRVSELINIHREDFRLISKQIYVRQGKGSVERITLTTPECAARVKKYLNTRKDHDPHLFISERRKTKITRQGVYKIIKGYVISAGLDIKISPHSLRHTFAVDLAIAGAPFELIMELLGHADYQNTKIYAKLTNKARRNMHAQYFR